MASINIALPESMREFVEEQIKSGDYQSANEYFEDLIRQDKKRKAQEKLETLLLEGLDSPPEELTATDWQQVRDQLQSRLSESGK